MRRKIKFNLLIIALLLLAITSIVSALEIDISLKPSFTVGESIFFSYTIASPQSQDIIYIPGIQCPNAPIAFLEEKTISLNSNVPYANSYTGIKVDDSIDSQECEAYIQILSPVSQRENKNFTIETTPKINLNILICKDESCSEKTKVFILGESVYLNYISDTSAISLSPILKYPNGNQEQITLPKSITPTQIGTYYLEVTASKQNYRATMKSSQFGVIKKSAEIKSIFVCNSNGSCDLNENSQSCPQDCPTGEKDGYCDSFRDGKCDPDCIFYKDPDCFTPTIKIITYTTVGVIVIILIIIIYLLRRKLIKKNLEKS